MWRTFFSSLMVSVITLHLAQPAAADFDRGVAAYMAADYPTALEELQNSIDDEDGKAAFVLGLMQLGGLGTPRDLKAARLSFFASAAKSYAPAYIARMASIISLLRVGGRAEGSEVDTIVNFTKNPVYFPNVDKAVSQRQISESLPWVTFAAQSRVPEAQAAIAFALGAGFGVEKNGTMAALVVKDMGPETPPIWHMILAEAFAGNLKDTRFVYDTSAALLHYTAAAEGGYLPAQIALAKAYLSGKIGSKNSRMPTGIDATKSLHWYRAAAEQGDANAQLAVAKFYMNAEGFAGAIDKDPGEAALWYKRAADNGNADAMYFLFNVYRSADPGANNPPTGEAYNWLRKAADAGHRDAMYLLGNYLESQQPEEALRYLIGAADRGDIAAQYKVGTMKLFGDTASKDLVGARTYLLNAATGGDTSAKFFYGHMLQNGLGGAKDAEGAAKWFQAAADEGNYAAQYQISFAYFVGSGVPESVEKARHYARLASLQGYSKAQDLYATLLLPPKAPTNESQRIRFIDSTAWALVAEKNGESFVGDNINKRRQFLSAADFARAKDLADRCLASEYKDCP